MEHLNRLAKEAIKELESNKTEHTITRIGKAIGTLAPVLDAFDFDQENMALMKILVLTAEPVQIRIQILLLVN